MEKILKIIVVCNWLKNI